MNKLRLTLWLLLVASAMTFFLSACGGSGSSPSAADTSTINTASWTNVSVRALDGKININWDRASDSSQTTSGLSLSGTLPTYNIYCSTDSTNIVQDKNRIAANYAGLSFDHTNVNYGTRYYYAITEVTSAGEGPASRTVAATPQALQPAAPYGLKVTALNSPVTSIQLDFMGPTPPNPAIVSYNLYRATSLAGLTADNSHRIKSYIPFTTPLTYIDNDPHLANGTTYYYAVTVIVAGKESGLSPVVSARPQATIPFVNYSATGSPSGRMAAFGSPTNVSAEPRNGSCVISWTAAALPQILGAPQNPQLSATPDYILYWSYSPDVLNDPIKVTYDDVANGQKADAAGVFSYTLPRLSLTNGTTYYLQLVAAAKDTYHNTFPGTPGPVVSVTPAPRTPAIPSGVSATQGAQQVLLTWTKDNSGIPNVTYNIYYMTTDPNTPANLMTQRTQMFTSASTNFTHSGLLAGKTYYYVITSVGGLGEGESAPSNVISVTL